MLKGLSSQYSQKLVQVDLSGDFGGAGSGDIGAPCVLEYERDKDAEILCFSHFDQLLGGAWRTAWEAGGEGGSGRERTEITMIDMTHYMVCHAEVRLLYMYIY